MQVKLNEDEIKSALHDWLKKQIPELTKDAAAKISVMSVDAYPASITVTIEFVLTEPVPSQEKKD